MLIFFREVREKIGAIYDSYECRQKYIGTLVYCIQSNSQFSWEQYIQQILKSLEQYVSIFNIPCRIPVRFASHGTLARGFPLIMMMQKENGFLDLSLSSAGDRTICELHNKFWNQLLS